jgi:photosystem II stability/assembly factor-like uncharacterized protein
VVARSSRVPRSTLLVALAAVVGLVASLVATDRAEGVADWHAYSSTATGPMEPGGDWMHAQRASGEPIPPDASDRALAALEQARERARNRGQARLVEGDWTHVGPFNLGSRVTGVAVDPNVPDLVYMTAATGGVWKSTDATTTWESIWPDDWVQSMGAVATTSDGTLFVGSGEANPGGGSITFPGNGLYRSHDQGETWERVGLEDSGTIGFIATRPDNDDIFVAATGKLFEGGGERGLYRSQDGGDTWDLVLEPVNEFSGASDIQIDQTDPDNIYVATWQRLREPDLRDYGGPGSGLWRSQDGGDTWEQMDNGLPADDDMGRPAIAVSESEPNRLYAITLDRIGRFRGFYESHDHGDSWTTINVPNNVRNSQSTYGWWFGGIRIDPLDADHAFLWGINLLETFDGGQTWRSHPYTQSPRDAIYADQQAMMFDPHTPGRIYHGNDGGMYRSDDNGDLGSWIKSEVEPIGQFYTVDVFEGDQSRKVGGTQDTRCLRNFTGGDEPDNDWWNPFGCGDGLQVLIHPEQPNIVYGCSQYGQCFRSTNYGQGPGNVSFRNRATSQRWNWLSPLVFDPNDPSIMYFAGNVLNRSTDGGLSWTAISPSLSDDPGRDPAGYPFGTTTAVAVSESDPDVLYAGTDDGKLWTTKDLGDTWMEVDEDQLPGTWVTRIAIDPDDPDIAYATFSGFRAGSDRAHVLRTEDGGETWHDRTTNLPDAPVNSVIALGDEALIVGSDAGVFVSYGRDQSWIPVGDDLPKAPVLYLRYHEPTGTINAATFGRGIYEFELELPSFELIAQRIDELVADGDLSTTAADRLRTTLDRAESLADAGQYRPAIAQLEAAGSQLDAAARSADRDPSKDAGAIRALAELVKGLADSLR